MGDIEKRGRLYILSAPSGSGKSTLKDKIMHILPNLVYSVSFTTRQPRPGETDGRDYNFVTHEEFERMRDAGDFLEWAEVFGQYYGTSQNWIVEKLAGGFDVLADLDVEGAAAVRRMMPEATLIFMVPPSSVELWRRLSLRRTETPEETSIRLGRAKTEIDRRWIYDYLLINDDLDRAAGELVEIISYGQGHRMSEMEDFWPSFFTETEGRP